MKYTPEKLKIVFDVLNCAPAYLSKQFILKDLLGWSDDMIKENVRLKQMEQSQMKGGDRTWQ